MDALALVAMIAANAPAGIKTMIDLKEAVVEVFDEVQKDFGDKEVSLDDLATALKAKIAALRETQNQINN